MPNAGRVAKTGLNPVLEPCGTGRLAAARFHFTDHLGMQGLGSSLEIRA